MNEIETETDAKAGPETESVVIELMTEQILGLTARLGLTETIEMVQLRESSLIPMDDDAFTLLLEQYLQLVDDKVNSNADRMAFLRAQVASILLNALIYLSNRRFDEYSEMLEAAAYSAPNLGEDELSEQIGKLHL